MHAAAAAVLFYPGAIWTCVCVVPVRTITIIFNIYASTLGPLLCAGLDFISSRSFFQFWSFVRFALHFFKRAFSGLHIVCRIRKAYSGIGDLLCARWQYPGRVERFSAAAAGFIKIFLPNHSLTANSARRILCAEPRESHPPPSRRRTERE